MSRDEQLELNRFIVKILKTKFKETFWTKLEGGDTAKALVVMTNNKNIIGRIQNYMVNNLDLIPTDGTKGHGNGGKFTRIITLSEIDPQVVKQIKHKYDLIIKKELEKKNAVRPEKSLKPIVSTIPVPEPVVEIISEVVKIEKDHELKSFTTSVSWMLKFEGVKSRSFSCDRMEPGKYCVICKSPDIASTVYSYLVWLAGDSSLVESDKDIVIIDYAGRVKKEKNLEKIHFCLPPAGAADSKEIKKRLIKVSPGSRPEVSDLGDGKFLIKYVRSNFVSKIFSVLLSMKWNVEVKDESSFIITTAEKQTAIDVISSPDPEILELEEIVMPSTNRDQFDLEVVQNPSSFLFGVESEEEAYKELEKIFGNKKLFTTFSSETQLRIIAALKEEARRRNPEEFAKNLLSIIGK